MRMYFRIISTTREVVNVLDCDIIASEFNLQSRSSVHFGINTFEKGMNPT